MKEKTTREHRLLQDARREARRQWEQELQKELKRLVQEHRMRRGEGEKGR